MNNFRIEMKHGQPNRVVEADSFYNDVMGGWLIFNRNGQEYWRTRLDCIVSMETIRKTKPQS